MVLKTFAVKPDSLSLIPRTFSAHSVFLFFEVFVPKSLQNLYYCVCVCHGIPLAVKEQL